MKIDRLVPANLTEIDTSPPPAKESIQKARSEKIGTATQPPLASEQRLATAQKGVLDTTASLRRSLLRQALPSSTSVPEQLIKTAAANLSAALPALVRNSGRDPETLMNSVRDNIRGSLANGLPEGADIEAIAFEVLMGATNDMDKDLQEIMGEVKSMTAAKSKLRDLLEVTNKDVSDPDGDHPPK